MVKERDSAKDVGEIFHLWVVSAFRRVFFGHFAGRFPRNVLRHRSNVYAWQCWQRRSPKMCGNFSAI